MTVMVSNKLCSKCGVEKPFSDFQKNKARRDGVETYCKECNNARLREKYSKNPKKKYEKTRAYHLKNAEWSKAYQHSWHQKNKTRRYEVIKERFKNDPEFKEYRRDMGRISGHKRRAQIANTKVEVVTKADYKHLLEVYEGKCWICNALPETVYWDHVHPLSKGGAHTVSNLRPSCINCNSRKGSLWPFTDEMKEKIANDVRALRTPQEHTIPVTDGKEVHGACHS